VTPSLQRDAQARSGSAPSRSRCVGRNPKSRRLTNPLAARRLWERTDRQIADEAPWVPLVNPKAVDVLSKRTGNYHSSLQGGVLIDQLWMR
jgi:hypothetical protein